MSILLDLLPDGVSAYNKWLQPLMSQGRPLTAGDLNLGQRVRDERARSQSVSATKRYETAKRFSLANSSRARSADRVAKSSQLSDPSLVPDASAARALPDE